MYRFKIPFANLRTPLHFRVFKSRRTHSYVHVYVCVANRISPFFSCDPRVVLDFAQSYPSDCGAPSTLCTERCGRPILNFFQDCDFTELSAALVYACSVNADGQTCGELVNTISLASSAIVSCLPASDACSNVCRTDLEALRETAGCCGNFTLTEGALGVNPDISDFSLWSACGVNVTGQCTEGAFNSGKDLAVTKITFMGLTVLVLATKRCCKGITFIMILNSFMLQAHFFHLYYMYTIASQFHSLCHTHVVAVALTPLIMTKSCSCL